jgi:hypothetical protein
MPPHDAATSRTVCYLCPSRLNPLTVHISYHFRRALDHGIEFLVGFELEFMLLKSTNPIELSNSRRQTLPPFSIDAKVLREIADGIQVSGIEVYHPEAAPGQVRNNKSARIITFSYKNLVRDGHRSLGPFASCRRTCPHQRNNLPHCTQARPTCHLCSQDSQRCSRELDSYKYIHTLQED